MTTNEKANHDSQGQHSNQQSKGRGVRGKGRTTHHAHGANSPKHRNSPHHRRPRGPRPFTPAELQARRDAVPTITYPAQLPVSARREDIAAAIENNQVVILAGETGSGKTTQLPKICLELGRGITGMIGHTQPRRIAARSVADRICEELGVQLGGAIGYQVRFTEQVSRTTLVKLMTDGILLAETQSDPELRKYDTIIIDEAHERSLNIDFLLGYLANLLPRRPDLKVIITSATIDSQRFAEHFGRHMYGGFPGNEAPIIEVSGRTFPVEIRYRPLYDGIVTAADETGDDHRERLSREEATDQVTGILDAAHELMAEGPGDILVFLSGEGEIRDTAKAFAEELGNRYIEPGGRSSVPDAVEVLPLFARLSGAEQRRIFQSHRHRRIILATNIAETSLTVPGIRYVIDPGTARISRYSNKTKVQRLPIEPISQASANQRSGRSGRVQDGIAIRLYSEEDFAARPEFTEPEIQRTSLASVILQMASMNLGSVEEFPFIDPPDMRAVRAGIQLLEEIGALAPMSASVKGTAIGSGTHLLTDVGRTLSRLPIDPRLGRMLLSASKHGCAGEVLVLVAAMSVQDVRERPAEFKAQADQLHARFTDRTSDFLAYLNLWRYLRTQQRELSGSAFRRMCRAEYLNWLRFREWQDVVAQLRDMARPLGMDITAIKLPTHAALAHAASEDKDNSHNQDVVRAVKELSQSADTPAADQIHRSLLVGLLSNLGSWDERTKDYLGARGTRFVIWPGSGLHRRNPSWVMAAELVETARLFARTAAQIRPEWVEEVGGHLVRTQHSEPFWSTREGAAMAHEKVTLYGLTLIADRKILLSKVGTPAARELAREMFIRHGLVENQWRAHHAFIKHNQEALAEAHEVEQRLRQVGLVADDDAQFVFFDERIPANIVSGRHFDSWWKRERHKNPELLNFSQEFLLGQTSADDDAFPDTWIQRDITLPIEYVYTPGSHADGLSIDVPVTLLPQLNDDGFDWLVPGMLDELVVATIRALPKPVRRHLVPAPDTAREILARLPEWDDVAHGQPGAPSFREAFNDAVASLRGVEITPEQWAEATLPPHLEITFRVRSERGTVLDESTSITDLQRRLAPQTRTAVESVVKGAVAQALEEARNQILPPQPCDTVSDQPLRAWPDTDELPALVETSGPHGMAVRGYPALVEVAGSRAVSLKVLAEPAEQVRDHRLGVIRLLATELALPEGRVTSRWTGDESLTMAAAPYRSTAAVVDDLHKAAARNIADRWAQANDKPLGRLRTRADYMALRDHVRILLEDEIYALVKVAVRVLRAYGQVQAKVRASSSLALINTVTDVREQIDALVYDGFLSTTKEDRLVHLVRYLQAAALRVDKAASGPAADDAAAWQVHEMEDLLADEVEAAGRRAYDPHRAATLRQARWMIEELRVSLFAQQLGTAGKVSPQRIRKLLAS